MSKYIAQLKAIIAKMEAESGQAVPTLPPAPPLERAKGIYKARRARDRHFPTEIFAEGNWDILLDLYSAHCEGRDISVSSACVASAVPPTTALRCIKTLQDQGLVERHQDPQDARRVYLRLTGDAVARMEALLVGL